LVLTKDERQDFVVRFLAELEQEHERRESIASIRRKKKGSRRTEAFKREEEEAELRNSLRREFYKEHGYKQATDRTGRQIWLSPAEYDAQHRVRRKRRKRTSLKVKGFVRLRDVLLFVLMCMSAVLIGLMLVR
jgi:hypothetical protein